MIKRALILTVCSLSLATSSLAQVLSSNASTNKNTIEVAEKLKDWDNTRAYLDSLDQERLPKIVSGGPLLDANFSSFIITEQGQSPLNSNMKAGLNVGGFASFTVTKHFHIMGQAMITIEQNRFAISNEVNNNLWSFGLDIPVYFMGRWGKWEKGFLYVGAGPYTHFTFASNIGKPWKNGGEKEITELDRRRAEMEGKYQDLYKLHRHYFGVAMILGYELPIGLQINLKYNISLSDIATFYTDVRKENPNYNTAILPNRVSLGVAYRYDRKHQKKK